LVGARTIKARKKPATFSKSAKRRGKRRVRVCIGKEVKVKKMAKFMVELFLGKFELQLLSTEL
jgi:hypothetical protein